MSKKTLVNLFLVLAMLLTMVSVASAAPPAQEEMTYTVRLGDNLWTLAEKYLGSGAAYKAIVGATNDRNATDSSFAKIDNPSLIHPGWKLLIPLLPACPPIRAPVQAKVPGEASDVKIPSGTFGYVDNPTTPQCDQATAWCNTAALGLVKIDVKTLNTYIANYGCFDDRKKRDPAQCNSSALAALDVLPSNICFPVANKQPVLNFDLRKPANQPRCMQPEVKTGCASYFAIYQLIVPIPASPKTAWCFVGNASLLNTATLTPTLAGGPINHFSTLALAELPEPQPVGPGKYDMVVASAFIEDVNGGIRVALTTNEITRIMRFAIQEGPKEWPPQAECMSPPLTDAERLTCLFPIDTPVSIDYSEPVVTITSLRDPSGTVTFDGTMWIF